MTLESHLKGTWLQTHLSGCLVPPTGSLPEEGVPSGLLVQQSVAVLRPAWEGLPIVFPSPRLPTPNPEFPLLLGYFLQLKAPLPAPHS